MHLNAWCTVHLATGSLGRYVVRRSILGGVDLKAKKLGGKGVWADGARMCFEEGQKCVKWGAEERPNERPHQQNKRERVCR